MRRNRSLYLAILLLLVGSAAAAETASEWDDGSSAPAPSEWDDGSAQSAPLADFGPAEAADLKDELDRRLRSVRSARAQLAQEARGDALARRLLEHEARLLVAAAGIEEVVDGAVREPAEIAACVDRARAAARAAADY